MNVNQVLRLIEEIDCDEGMSDVDKHARTIRICRFIARKRGEYSADRALDAVLLTRLDEPKNSKCFHDGELVIFASLHDQTVIVWEFSSDKAVLVTDAKGEPTTTFYSDIEKYAARLKEMLVMKNYTFECEAVKRCKGTIEAQGFSEEEAREAAESDLDAYPENIDWDEDDVEESSVGELVDDDD